MELICTSSMLNLALSIEAKAKTWKEHYEHLLSVEFPWTADNLPSAEPVLGPPILITGEMVVQAINKMKQSKAPGPTGIVAKMLKASVEVSCPLLCDIANAIIAKGVIPGD